MNIPKVASPAFKGRIELRSGDTLYTYASQDNKMLARVRSTLESEDAKVEGNKWELVRFRIKSSNSPQTGYLLSEDRLEIIKEKGYKWVIEKTDATKQLFERLAATANTKLSGLPVASKEDVNPFYQDLKVVEFSDIL